MNERGNQLNADIPMVEDAEGDDDFVVVDERMLEQLMHQGGGSNAFRGGGSKATGDAAAGPTTWGSRHASSKPSPSMSKEGTPVLVRLIFTHLPMPK